MRPEAGPGDASALLEAPDDLPEGGGDYLVAGRVGVDGMFAPIGDGAHIQVHSQIRATLSGTVPTPGSVAAWAKSVSLKAACTSATGMPKAPKLASSSELR